MDLSQEKELVEKAKHSPEAFGMLYDEYFTQIFRYILKRTVDVRASEDITAEVFIKAYNGLKKYEWRSISFLNWLYRIASNEINNYYRKNRSHLSFEELFEKYGFDPGHNDTAEKEILEIEDKLQEQADLVSVKRCLDKIPPKYREVVALKYLEGKDTSEISTILNSKETTVRSILHRGLEKLRLEMTNDNMQHLDDKDVVDSEGRDNEQLKTARKL